MHDLDRPWNRRPSTRALAVAGVVGLSALAATAALALDGGGGGDERAVRVQLASSDDDRSGSTSATASTVDDHGGDRPNGGHGADDGVATTAPPSTVPPTTVPPTTAPPTTSLPTTAAPSPTTTPVPAGPPATVDDHGGDRPGGHGADDGVTTTAPPTTTPPPATAPPAPTAQVLERGGAGGSISVAWDGATLRLVDVRPAAGWSTEVHHDAGREVSVRFESGERETRVELEVEDGGVRDRVEERD